MILLRTASSYAVYGSLILIRNSSSFSTSSSICRRHFSRSLLLRVSSRSDEGKSHESNVPLVFIHGMKGSHLVKKNKRRENNDGFLSSFYEEMFGNGDEKVWLSLPALLNFPPCQDDDPSRSLSLPLTYSESYDGKMVQDRGDLEPEGLVDYIVEFPTTFLPFYGHISHMLREYQDAGIRPTAAFVFDWRRSVPELADDFHKFCEEAFPGRPVQILAHSLGGLIAFTSMRQHPEKYSPGGVLVGVPFGTGIQYLQDLHRGYFTELGRCRQFTPPSQFTSSSHWSFFPLRNDDMDDIFLDVTDCKSKLEFQADESAIGNPGTVFNEGPSASHEGISPILNFDFYDVNDWEANEIGIFDPKYQFDRKTLMAYRRHMKIQLEQAKEWRLKFLSPATKSCNEKMPDLIVCQTNTVPTLNQILRRKKKNDSISSDNESNSSKYEYDYVSGRSVPGDGRIDFAKSFPPEGFDYSQVELDSLHAKQLCMESEGGSLVTILDCVDSQLEKYLNKNKKYQRKTSTVTQE